MKTIQVNGQNITGKNYTELKAKIKDMGLTGKEFEQAMAAANIAFPKKTASNKKDRSYVQTPGKTPRVDAKPQVQITRLKDGNHTLVVITGPSTQVVKEVRGNKNMRNLVHAEVEASVIGRDPIATIVALEGNVDRAKAGDVFKEIAAAYINKPGFSRLSSVKAVKAFGKQGYAPVGENLNKENVRRFVQSLVAAMYDGAALRGAKMGEEAVSTNVFLATDTRRRQMAWWPAGSPDQYLVLDLATKAGDPSVSYLGSVGLFGIMPDGQVFTTNFEHAFETAIVAGLKGVSAKTPWIGLDFKIDAGKMGKGPIEASVAQPIKDKEGKTTGFAVYLTGHGQLAILEISVTENAFRITKATYLPFESDMALLGFVNDGATAVVMNRNGGTSLFGFRPIAEIGLNDHLPAGIIAAQKVRSERIAARQSARQ